MPDFLNSTLRNRSLSDGATMSKPLLSESTQLARAASPLPLSATVAVRQAEEDVSPLMAPSETLHDVSALFSSVSGSSADAEIYRDWFHGFVTLVRMLSAHEPEKLRENQENYRGLLKAELLRGMVQSAYRKPDVQRLKCDWSPLSQQRYGRWSTDGLQVAAVRLKIAEMKEYTTLAEILEKFGIPISTASEAWFLRRVISSSMAPSVTPGAAEFSGESEESRETKVYVPSASLRNFLDEVLSDFDFAKNLYFRGLQPSHSRAAEICADAIFEKICQKDLKGAAEIIDADLRRSGINIVRAVAQVEHSGSAQGLMLEVYLDEIDSEEACVRKYSFKEPLTSSTESQLRVLRLSYSQLMRAGLPGFSEEWDFRKIIPFYIYQNLQVVLNLVGDIRELCKTEIPAIWCADLSDALIDALQQVHLHTQMAKQAPVGVGVLATGLPSKNESRHIHRFSHTMQKVHHAVRQIQGRESVQVNFREAVISLLFGAESTSRSLLSTEDVELLSQSCEVELAPYAMTMINNIMESTSGSRMGILRGGYFETLELLNPASSVFHFDGVDDHDLRDVDVVFMEPHPNNAAAEVVSPHDPVKLLNNLFSGPYPSCRTVVMDVTLNHLAEDEVANVLKVAVPHVQAGRLNLILVQSLAKFTQNGMDQVSMGLGVVFNNKTEAWASFRKNMSVRRTDLAPEDKAYMARMLSRKNSAAAMAYLERIRDNTSYLQKKLESCIPVGHRLKNAFEVRINTDQKSAYVTLALTKQFVQCAIEQMHENADERLSVEEVKAQALNFAYESGLLPAVADLGIFDRPSLAFQVTNVGLCGGCVRVTPGIEEGETIDRYVESIVRAGAEAYANMLRALAPAAPPTRIHYPSTPAELPDLVLP